MLRRLGLALSCLVAIAVPAQANDAGHGVDGSSIAVHQGATPSALASATRERTAPVQVPRMLPPAQSGLGASSLAGLRREAVDQSARPHSLLPQRRHRQESVAFPWLGHGRSGFALSLTERLVVGLGYRHVQGEDLWPEFADTGAVDYDSHHVLIRAHWRF